MGVTYTPADGKKNAFPGKVMRLSDIVNIPIEIHDFETGIDTKRGGKTVIWYRSAIPGLKNGESSLLHRLR